MDCVMESHVISLKKQSRKHRSAKNGKYYNTQAKLRGKFTYISCTNVLNNGVQICGTVYAYK